MSLKKLSERIYILPPDDLTDRPTLGYIKGDRFCLAVDAGNSKKHVDKFYKCLESMNLKKPDFTAITHSHWDHTFGMHSISGISIACGATNDELIKMSDWGWSDVEMSNRLCLGIDIEFCDKHIKIEYENLGDIHVVTSDIVFNNQLTLDLGGVTVILTHTASPHSDDCVLVYVPEEKAIFVGDADCGDYHNNDGKYDKARLKHFIELIESIDFEKYILGHDFPETKEGAIHYLKDELSKLV